MAKRTDWVLELQAEFVPISQDEATAWCAGVLLLLKLLEEVNIERLDSDRIRDDH